MATVQLKNVSKRYGATEVLRGIDLDIADGELVVLVGPSGCGKSTLLRMLCGLEEISGGEIIVDGTVVNDTPPAGRGIAMVFQSYALYPHMSVFRNMAFGLKIHGAGRAERKQRVHEAAKALQIEHLLDRLPRELSGGQRQRVAIGRAIVRQPKLFLFDEPLSNLDAALRVKTRIELSRLHRELGATMVYVTHDQVEAMTLGDKIVVMHEGRIQQAGTPLELYQRPANRFVASFIGSPTINLLPGTLLPDSGAHEIGIRPEHLQLAEPGRAPPGGLHLRGEITLVEQLGESHLVYLRSEQGLELVMRGTAQTALRPGEAIEVVAAADSLSFFDTAGQALR
ncbi:sn-glycerol-3-phosphate ABC transporter ATP-binding protein UgpC [Paucibacter sp. R3-3]|uniref:Sn-glycerol-3-phosphate ABC transporter ATP-binding protein UgpC n=1 Tax=Roseateles agri TaxID=3098619 RepID=A0ABU5DMD5_9BURK|nr:sn-glycerol-3-phosphate ABC transporter ATP-binding protein UgpC [Paucibacter sp. R3-3]MDY0747470.1 sn-glycerol-3-phosphate ABC transporter ATP-binding protein UgpC [Paucibacter sp. R3-3]